MSPTREIEDKHQDAHDFIRIIRNHPSLNVEKLSAMGRLACVGGEKEILKLVEDARAGRRLEF